MVLSVLLAGCGFTGVNSIPLPFSKGSGGDAIHVTVYLADAANLVANSEVRYRDVVVGSVRRATFDDWRAKLDVGLEPDVLIPKDATVKVAQKSLLGAEYLQFEDPAERPGGPDTLPVASDAAAVLQDGDSIGVERTGRFPETEEVLAGAALLLNNGGLPQIRSIAAELNAALGGRGATVRKYVRRLTEFVGALDDQRAQITGALEQLDRLAVEIEDDRPTVEKALRELPDGIEVLSEQRQELVSALRSAAKLGRTTRGILKTSESDLEATLRSLVAVTKALQDAGPSVGRAFNALSTPFTVAGARKVLIGDYLNLFATVRVSVPELEKYFLGGTPLDGLFTGLLGSLPTGPVVDQANPLLPPNLQPDASLLSGVEDLLSSLGEGDGALQGGATGRKAGS